jgi:molybdate transport system substrate-binding protein
MVAEDRSTSREEIMKARSKIVTSAAALCLAALASCGGAVAAEVALVSSAGPLPEVLGAMAPMFEKASGHKLKLAVKSGPDIIKAVKAGDAIDLVITNDEFVDALVKDGSIAANGSSKIMLSRVGAAVRAGAAKPDISTVAAFKAALVNAKTIAYSRGTSGQHLETVIERLGLTEALKAKTIRVQGQPVGAVVAKGEAEFGIQQVAELLPVAGIDMIGPLPNDLQKIIVYMAGIPAKAKEADAAKAFVKFVTSEGAVAKLKTMGIDPVN